MTIYMIEYGFEDDYGHYDWEINEDYGYFTDEDAAYALLEELESTPKKAYEQYVKQSEQYHQKALQSYETYRQRVEVLRANGYPDEALPAEPEKKIQDFERWKMYQHFDKYRIVTIERHQSDQG